MKKNQTSQFTTVHSISMCFYAFILLTVAFPVIAHSAEIMASVDQTRISLSDSINLTIKISEDTDAHVDVSGIRDFTVRNRGQSTSIRIVNNRMTKEITYNYLLFPKKTGRLKIPALTVQSKGKKQTTQEISIHVSKNSQTAGAQENILVKAAVSNKTPYQGQQIIYKFQFFTQARVHFTNARFQKPEFSGFAAKEVEPAKQYPAVISGREYNVNLLTYVLIPLKSGRITIKPAVLTCDVVRKKARPRSGFGFFLNDPFFNTADPKTFRTKPVNLTVKPLPEYNGKVKFSGLVGTFFIESHMEEHEIKQGESATLSVTVQGYGNIMDAESPEIIMSEHFKVYKDQPEEKFSLDVKKGYSGKKIFRHVLVPVKPGKFSIPGVRLCYFDVNNGRYKIISSEPVVLTALPGDEQQSPELFSAEGQKQTTGPDKKKVQFTGRDILPLKKGLDSIESKISLSEGWFFLLLIIPGLIFGVVKTVLIFTKKQIDSKTLMARRALKALKHAVKNQNISKDFFSSLHKALLFAVFSHANLKGESLTYAEVKDILTGSGASEQITEQAAALLKKIEAARYSGAEMDNALKQETLSQTNEIVKKLCQ